MKQYLVEVGLEIEVLEQGEWRKHIEFAKVQVGARDKLNATLRAVEFYQDKDNVEFVLNKDIVSSKIWSIVKCDYMRGE